MTPPPHRDVQRPLSIARAAGVVASAVAIALKDSWPFAASETTAWVVVAVVALGSVVSWGWARGSRSESDLQKIGVLGFALDGVLVFGLVWAFAWDFPFIVALLPLVPLSGGLRYRRWGAVAGAIAVAVFTGLVALEWAPDPGGGGPVLLAGASNLGLGAYVFLVAVSSAVGAVTAFVAETWHDRRLEFEKQAARLVELDQLKDRYIAITSHEIRGPVSTMITAVDTVRSRWDKLEPDRRDHLLEMVYLQGRELDRLVQDLFISAEMQGGGLNLQPEWVELDATIKRAVEAASGKRRAHLLELFVDPLRVELDPYRVTQIVRNLVENAYKYTEDRTRVVVSAKGTSAGIQLEVRDDGQGIPPDKRDKLFEAFSRIEETAAGQEGVGLGLYVVSQLVAAMNGRIDLQSSSRGTTFSIFVPCSTAPLGRPHIGLVDDEATHG